MLFMFVQFQVIYRCCSCFSNVQTVSKLFRSHFKWPVPVAMKFVSKVLLQRPTKFQRKECTISILSQLPVLVPRFETMAMLPWDAGCHSFHMPQAYLERLVDMETDVPTQRVDGAVKAECSTKSPLTEDMFTMKKNIIHAGRWSYPLSSCWLWKILAMFLKFPKIYHPKSLEVSQKTFIKQLSSFPNWEGWSNLFTTTFFSQDEERVELYGFTAVVFWPEQFDRRMH